MTLGAENGPDVTQAQSDANGRDAVDDAQAQIDRLVGELEKAEAYEQRLRQFIVDVKAELAAGRTASAMSMLNEALRFIDDATDVVAPHRPGS